jgi:hypothetical protein
MKKFLPAFALIAALATPSVASAANEYTISYSTNPTKSGTSKQPAAVSGKFGFSVRDTEGGRPFALDALRVTFTGVRINTRQFATCTAAKIEAAQSDAGCPAALARRHRLRQQPRRQHQRPPRRVHQVRPDGHDVQLRQRQGRAVRQGQPERRAPVPDRGRHGDPGLHRAHRRPATACRSRSRRTSSSRSPPCATRSSRRS